MQLISRSVPMNNQPKHVVNQQRSTNNILPPLSNELMQLFKTRLMIHPTKVKQIQRKLQTNAQQMLGGIHSRRFVVEIISNQMSPETHLSLSHLMGTQGPLYPIRAIIH